MIELQILPFVLIIFPGSSTLIRAKQLEAEERANLRQSIQTRPHSMPPPGAFSDDIEDDPSSRVFGADEEDRIGLNDDTIIDVDDDHIAIGNVGYHDEFTDNDSDVFEDGDGDEVEEAYTLHRRVDSR